MACYCLTLRSIGFCASYAQVLPGLLLQAPGLSQHSVQCHYDPGKWDEGLVTFYNLDFFKTTSRWKSV